MPIRYIHLVPNQRAQGQRHIPILMSEDFLLAIADGMKLTGHTERARFVRDAVYEKLLGLGMKLPIAISKAPGRAGKGGRRKRLQYIIKKSAEACADGKPTEQASFIEEKEST
jgi:hypothetical protein